MPLDGAAIAYQASPPHDAGAAGQYTAFISYSHADEVLAAWLHRRLESYRIPKTLQGARIARRLGKIFRDRVDLNASHDLGAEIRKALDRSDALVLICSPRSAKSPYVAEEIRRFKEAGKGERIFAVIADGEPHASSKPGRSADQECFPQALLCRIDSDGLISSHPEPAEPLAADFRRGKDGRDNGSLKIIAGLLGVDFDDLVQRERRAERSRRLRANAIATSMTVLALGALAAGGIAWWQQGIANANRAEAVSQRGLAEERGNQAREQRDLATANEKRAVAGEELAKRNADEAIAEALRATQAESVAAGERDNARNTLHRFFATRAWDQRSQGNLALAARYALAGLALGTTTPEENRAVLGAIVFEAGQTQTILPSASAVVSAVYSTDGETVVTASADGSATIWGSRNGQPRQQLNRHTQPLTAAAFSPDGTRVVVTSRDQTASIWDAQSGRLLTVLTGHRKAITGAVFSPDGQYVLTWSIDETARVWNVSTGVLSFTLQGGRPIAHAAYTPDGNHIVTAAGRIVKIWSASDGVGEMLLDHSIGAQLGIEASSGTIPKTVESQPTYSVANIAISPSGALIAAQSIMDGVIIWSTLDGSIVRRLNARIGSSLGQRKESGVSIDYDAQSAQIAFSGDGALIASVNPTRSVSIWSAKSGQELDVLDEFSQPLSSIAFSPDSRRLAAADQAGAIRIWSADSPSRTRRLAGHSGSIESVAFSPDGRMLLSASRDGSARIWDVSETAQGETLTTKTGSIEDFDLGSDGRIALVSKKQAEVWMRSAAAASLIWKGHEGNMNSIALSSSGRVAVTSSDDKTAKVWDTSTGQIIATLSGHDEDVLDAAFCGPDDSVVTASDDILRIWTSNFGKEPKQLRGAPDLLEEVECSKDGQLVAGATSDTIMVWNTMSGKLIWTLTAHTEFITDLAFSRNGTRLISTSDDRTGIVWDMGSGRIVARLTDHPSQVTGADFSDDGFRIVTSSEDYKARVWEAETGRLLTAIDTGNLLPRGVRFTGNDTSIVLAGMSMINRWNVAPLLETTHNLRATACTRFLSPQNRQFLPEEFDADLLLRAQWPEKADVCAYVVDASPASQR